MWCVAPYILTIGSRSHIEVKVQFNHKPTLSFLCGVGNKNKNSGNNYIFIFKLYLVMYLVCVYFLCPQCPFCSKAFLNSSFLQSHIHRRHGGAPVAGEQQSSPSNQQPEPGQQVRPAEITVNHYFCGDVIFSHFAYWFQGFFYTVCASGKRRRSQSKRPRSQWNEGNIFPIWLKKLWTVCPINQDWLFKFMVFFLSSFTKIVLFCCKSFCHCRPFCIHV